LRISSRINHELRNLRLRIRKPVFKLRNLKLRINKKLYVFSVLCLIAQKNHLFLGSRDLLEITEEKIANLVKILIITMGTFFIDTAVCHGVHWLLHYIQTLLIYINFIVMLVHIIFTLFTKFCSN